MKKIIIMKTLIHWAIYLNDETSISILKRELSAQFIVFPLEFLLFAFQAILSQ